ncbi:MAG: hypothetical protein WB797_03565 [Nocardioides sp.]
MTEQPGDQPTDPTQPAQPEGSAPTPPPAAPTPPPEAPAAPAAPASTGGSQYDFDQAKTTLQGAHKFDLGIMAAGIIAFLAGFMPFYKLSVSVGGFGGSGSWSAWHGFFGWFAVLVALAGAVAVALELFKVVTLPMPVHQIAAGAFGLALLCLILALFVNPLPSCGGVPGCSRGHGFGYWLALIVVLAGTVLAVLRMRESTTKATSA